MFSTADTIVAIATPPGHGGLGVVRVSGTEALRIATTLLGTGQTLVPRRATVGKICDAGTRGLAAVDEVVATFFKAPGSYTREDVVEIGAHGSPVLLGRIVAMAIGAGARLAEPGEFTLRAYLNGRIDLVQAEAVADLVAAVTPAQARAAMDQLEGTLTSRINRLMERLFDVVARLEASIDFPDEGFHFIERDATTAELDRLIGDFAALQADGAVGRLLREGAMVAVVGRPNAGKSSLFNRLVGADRTIVSSEPGTTRDAVTERADIQGLPVTLVDTAGLRDADHAVEIEGIRRARQATEVAALTLVVIDASLPRRRDDLDQAGAGRQIIVLNKCDLPMAWVPPTDGLPTRVVRCSATTGEGLADLRRQIADALTTREDLRDTPAISNARHLALVDRAAAATARARDTAVSGGTEEVILVDLNLARAALEELTGRTTSEDVLRHVFARFCVGK